MFLIILLAALAIAGLITTIVDIRRDGHRRVPTNWTRVAEHDPLGDASSITSYR